ncbi:MAG: hypothetical protein HKN44_05300 [Ilumatobacter sp.]|nr:hypothetical protein [Ilumatobacter sp.]
MIRSALAICGGVLRRPGLWPTALRQARRLARPGWWRRAPFLPIPPADYLEFRMVTQYGDAAHRAEVDDVVKYLRWCREWERADRPA